jgi:hypothetical protein
VTLPVGNADLIEGSSKFIDIARLFGGVAARLQGLQQYELF